MEVDRPLLHALGASLRGGWRLFTLRHAPREDFALSPELFALLVALDFVLLFAFAVAAVGLEGDVNVAEIPRALMFVPLALALGMMARRVASEGELLRLPVALAAAGLLFTLISSAMYLLAQRQWLPFLETYWAFFDYFVLAWSAAVVVVAALRLTSGAFWKRAGLGVAGVILLVLPSLWLPLGLIWMPRYDERTSYATGSFHSLAAESSFYAQHGALERELSALEPERPGVADIYLVTAALYAGEDVFMKESRMIASLFRERFDAAGRTVMLVNNPKTVQEHPVASVTSIREALAHVGSVMNVEEDVLVLYVSSHGSENHELVVDFRPLRFAPVTPQSLKSALVDSGIRWKIVVVSACYSGGFVDALKDERTLVITASSAERQSFGCGSASDATYLAQALFGEALRKTFSFEAAAGEARLLVERWERERNQKPSEPQVYIGAEIRAKLSELESRLSRRPTAGK
jgi:hypothetical protein